MDNQVPEIYVIDAAKEKLSAEEGAMMQALYSRSSESAKTHLERVKKDGTSFMKSFYLGYGHASIGQTGSTTVHLEGISMLAAKALEDSPLYNGQEKSSRYLDFTTVGCEVPESLGDEGRAIAKAWRELYIMLQEPVLKHLTETHPCPDNVKEKVWEKTLKARCFDITRGYLPCGTYTSASIHTTLHHAQTTTQRLMTHPLQEVNDIGTTMHMALEKEYPGSFTAISEMDSDHWEYLVANADVATYNYERLLHGVPHVGFTKFRMDEQGIKLLNIKRPKYAPLAKALEHCGTINVQGIIDFGSFRDIQRHRHCVQKMPIVDLMSNSFHSWYLDQLPEEARAHAVDIISGLRTKIAALHDEGCSLADLQYICPMGTNVAVRFDMGLPALVYTMELRSGATVHPTLRRFAQEVALRLDANIVPLQMHYNKEPDSLDARRGTQDIIRK